MKTILLMIPLFFCSCFLPATETVSICFPEVPEPWVKYWNGGWDIVLTDGTTIQNGSGQKGQTFSADLPCGRAWIILVRPVLDCRISGPIASCRLDSTMEEAFPLWSGGVGAEILLRLDDSSLVQTLNLERFFTRLDQLEDPQSLDGRKLEMALQNGSINHYSFDVPRLFSVTLDWPLGSWIAGNWYHPVEKVNSRGLPAGVHAFFSDDGESIFLVMIGEMGQILTSAIFPARMAQKG